MNNESLCVKIMDTLIDEIAYLIASWSLCSQTHKTFPHTYIAIAHNIKGI